MKKFEYEAYTEWDGSKFMTTTKVYAVLPRVAYDAIAKEEKWSGCHWDAPDVLYSECVEGVRMSPQAETIIDALHAEEHDEDEEM